jgi:hypothetical protein
LCLDARDHAAAAKARDRIDELRVAARPGTVGTSIAATRHRLLRRYGNRRLPPAGGCSRSGAAFRMGGFAVSDGSTIGLTWFNARA